MDASEILHFTWIITLANSCQNIRYSRSQKWYLCTYLTKYVKTVIFVQSSMKTEKTFFCFILNIINHSAIVTICFAKFFISVCSNMRLYRTATFFCCCHYSDIFRCSFSKLQIHLMVKKKKDLWKFQAFIFFFLRYSCSSIASGFNVKKRPESGTRKWLQMELACFYTACAHCSLWNNCGGEALFVS